MHATETVDFEHEFAELVRELRALPTAAPATVRARVHALGEPAPAGALPRIPWRRSLLVLAPVCVLALVSAAVVHGVLNTSRSHREVFSNAAVDGAARSNPELSHGAGALAPNPLRSRLAAP